MKKLALLLVIFAFSVISAPAQILEILKRMEAHQKGLKTLQANLIISNFSVQSGGTFTKEGVVKFLPLLKDYSLRIDSTKPAAESFLIVQNQYLLYQPNLKTAYTGIITDSQKITVMLFSLLSNFSKEKLKTDFYIKYTGEEKVSDTTLTWHLELAPKTATGYKTIELWVDGNGMPLQSKTIENSGDSATVLLTNLQKNVTMKAADFKIDLPKNAKIIKN